MNENVYICMEKAAKTQRDYIAVQDIASVFCENKDIQNRIKMMRIYSFTKEDIKENEKALISSLKVVETIVKEIKNVTICPMGSTECVVMYDSKKRNSKLMDKLKTFAICTILFFGSGFTIMTFHNDISIEKLFGHIYKYLTGEESNGFTILEIMFCIGIFLGIVIFYNHFGYKKISSDPTPVEIEMRKYENDINNTYADGIRRKDANIDVD